MGTIISITVTDKDVEALAGDSSVDVAEAVARVRDRASAIESYLDETARGLVVEAIMGTI